MWALLEEAAVGFRSLGMDAWAQRRAMVGAPQG
jgi:hypothetical protein